MGKQECIFAAFFFINIKEWQNGKVCHQLDCTMHTHRFKTQLIKPSNELERVSEY